MLDWATTPSAPAGGHRTEGADVNEDRPLLIGATAADPANVVLIWNAIRSWFNEHGLPVEYALYSTYDALCAALLAGAVDIAWNAPMAHAQSLLVSGGACRTLAMRDTDRDVASIIIARTGRGISTVADLRGRTVAVGVPTSTELRLLPAHQLRALGFDLERDCAHAPLTPRPASNGVAWIDDFLIFDAVLDGRADAGVIFEPWLAHLTRKREVAADALVTVWRSEPFCHCAFTARPGLGEDVAATFVDLLVAMDPSDPAIADMMRREHLTRWLPASDAGWQHLLDAIRSADLEGATFN